MATAVHVTHEAVLKVGGIGPVLQGLIAAPAYAAAVPRTLLVGPLLEPDSAAINAGSNALVLFPDINATFAG